MWRGFCCGLRIRSSRGRVGRRLVRRRVAVVATFAVTVAGFVGGVAPASAPAAGASDLTSASLVSARLQAKLADEKVLVSGLSTPSSETWANPDGTLTSVIGSGPFQVQNSDGSWTPLSTALETTSGGSLSPVAMTVPVTFPGGGLAASVSVGSSSLGIGLQGAVWPAPSVSGSSATFAGVAAGEDLVDTATGDGFDVDIRLTSPAASEGTFVLPLQSQGLKVSQDPTSGQVSFSTGSSSTFLTMAAPTVRDDSGIGQGPSSGSVKAVLGSWGAGQALEVTPDPGFLDHATYPVDIHLGFSAGQYEGWLYGFI